MAIAANAVAKWVLALTHGTRQMALWFAGGLLTMISTAALLLWAGP